MKNNFTLSPISLTLIPFGIAVNLIMGEIVALLKIPLYLDSVGTIFISATCGMYAGVLCGILSNLLAGILFNSTMIFFIPVSIVIAIFSGFVAEKKSFSSFPKTVIFGLLQGVFSAIVAAPIAAFVFGGITLGGTDFVVLYFRAMGNNILESVFYQGLSSDPIDKCLSYIIVFFILQRLPSSFLQRLPFFVKHTINE